MPAMARTVIILLILAGFSSAQDAPDYQSVSGQFARDWLNNSGIVNQMPSTAAAGSSNASDLWSWGGAPRGSRIVDGELVTDPNYLRSIYNLSSNWLDETYTDSATGLPMEVYSDPVSGRMYYVFLSPATGKAFFTYYTYTDSRTGRLVYVYVDPSTGKEVTSDTKPLDVILLLAGSQTVAGQNEPWIGL